MKKKSDELKAQMESLEAEKTAIQGKINQISHSYYEAVRKEQRAKPLSPMMTNIAKQLASGAYIQLSRHYNAEGAWLEVDGDSKNLTDATFRGLRDREIISESATIDSLTTRWDITEYGRSVVAGLEGNQ